MVLLFDSGFDRPAGSHRAPAGGRSDTGVGHRSLVRWSADAVALPVAVRGPHQCIMVTKRHDAMMHAVRTTVTLEPDVEALVQTAMRERNLSFKDAVNEAIRAGLRPGRPKRRVKTPVFGMGVPTVSIGKALQLADALEDDEIVRKMALGK
jgi:hypothetical protein